MKTVFTGVILLASHLLFSQAPSISWQKCLGGSGGERAYSIQQTSDGGYIVAGFTGSNDGDVSGIHGEGDFWVAKLYADGSIDWQKCLGGSMGWFDSEMAYSIQQTSDGGYIVAGKTGSNDGDVSGNHGGDSDIWVVKLDTEGSITWQKCLGGTAWDGGGGWNWDEPGFSIQQTSDGGYIVAGHTTSNDGEVSGWHEGYDMYDSPKADVWIVKLDAEGLITWQKCLGGSGYEWSSSIQQTLDGGYIFSGNTESYDGDVSGNHGGPNGGDIWVVKLSVEGSITWQKCLGGSLYERAGSVQQTLDGGYIVAGGSWSNDGDVSGNHGTLDMWVVKLNPEGSITWQKCLGGNGSERVYSIQQTSDGGYILVGEDGSCNHGNLDVWVGKLNAEGSITWQKCLGGSGAELAYSIQQTSDEGYIVAGYTTSNDGDVSGNHGIWDAWVVALGTISGVTEVADPVIAISPNPVSDILTVTSDRQIDSYKIANVDGKVIRSESIDAECWSVDMSNEVPGIYIIIMNDGVKLQTIKFLIAN